MIHLSIVKSTDCGIFKRTPTCFIWKQFALSARQPSKDSSTTGSEKREKCTLTELFTTNCYEYCRWTEIAFRYVVSREMFCNAGRFPATRAGVRCAYCAVQFEVRPRRSNRHQYDGLCHDAKKFPVTTIFARANITFRACTCQLSNLSTSTINGTSCVEPTSGKLFDAWFINAYFNV